MRNRKQKLIIPLLGLYSGTAIMTAMIHFWFADLVGSVLDMSPQAAYGALLTLLTLITLTRTVLIIKGKDQITNWIEDKFDERSK